MRRPRVVYVTAGSPVYHEHQECNGPHKAELEPMLLIEGEGAQHFHVLAGDPTPRWYWSVTERIPKRPCKRCLARQKASA